MAPSYAIVVVFLLAASCSLVPCNGVVSETYMPAQKREESSEDNPYVFDRESFITKARSQAGEIRALPNFRQQSELLRGLENYRNTYIEMKPNSLMIPHSIDAHWLLVCVEGRGFIAYVHENNLVERKLEEGDMFLVPSGRIFYLVNNDNRQTFRLVNLLYTVSTPGMYQPYYVVGGRNPESVFSAFSHKVLEAAMGKEAVERMQKGESQEGPGVIIQLSGEEIQRIPRGQSRESVPTAEDPQPLNIYNQRPIIQNNYGRLIEVQAKEFPCSGYPNTNVGVLELRAGSMIVPNFNTKSMKIAVVLSGEGELEIACPHLSGGQRGSESESESEREQEQGEISYAKVRATLRTGTVFVVPTAHPSTVMASSNGQMRILCFEINAEGNQRHFLAGNNNVLKVLDRRVLGRILRMAPDEVEQMLEQQRNEPITSGPHGVKSYASM